MSAHDKNQLAPSIEKLFHYLLVHTKHDTKVWVYDGEAPVYYGEYIAPKSISISPTLYTRIDGCHGAGNCCRVPFDLVYSGYDRQRIVDYHHDKAVADFGKESAEGFRALREVLLGRLHPLRVRLSQDQGGTEPHVWETMIWVQRNEEKLKISGRKSCPYLITGEDRYFCGVHPFKPLHCWYPHMVVRAMQPRTEGQRPTVSIGRMQYGRNHNFGCPVLFEESISEPGGDVLFDEPGQDGPYYFDNQFQDDVDKLLWTANSALSMGFAPDNNYATELAVGLANSRQKISDCLRDARSTHITLWDNPS